MVYTGDLCKVYFTECSHFNLQYKLVHTSKSIVRKNYIQVVVWCWKFLGDSVCLCQVIFGHKKTLIFRLRFSI
jgi:hypothetical protein